MNDEHHEAVRERIEADKHADPPPEFIEAVQAAIAAAIQPYTERMKAGILRIVMLASTAKAGLDTNDPLNKTTAEDILRAAVVLIHAHLEDFLRTIAGVLLPVGDESFLNSIPLAGLKGRPEKFSLGKLVQHKGKSVDDVLRESVSEYLDRRTFNNTEEITQLLGELGVDTSKVNECFPAIQQMMKRRHQIVHRVDRIRPDDPTVLEAITPDQVEAWVEAATKFIASFLGEIAMKLPLAETTSQKLVEELAVKLPRAETAKGSAITTAKE
jgi:hypothetical protein